MSNLFITAKELKQRLKYGDSVETFAEKYGVSESEFFAYLDRAFSAKAVAAFRRDLARNTKRPKAVAHLPDEEKANNTVADQADTSNVVDVLSEQENAPTAVDVLTEQENAPNAINATSTSATENATPSLALDDLRAKETELSLLLIKEESKHSDLVSKRAALKEKFKEQKAQLLDYQKKIATVKKQFEESYSEWDSLGIEMKSQTEKISSLRDDLQLLREEIKILSQISILVYSNGEIERHRHT